MDGVGVHVGFTVCSTLLQRRVPEELKSAIQKAKKNIEIFHSAQVTSAVRVETQPGVNCWQKKLPIEKNYAFSFGKEDLIEHPY